MHLEARNDEKLKAAACEAAVALAPLLQESEQKPNLLRQRTFGDEGPTKDDDVDFEEGDGGITSHEEESLLVVRSVGRSGGGERHAAGRGIRQAPPWHARRECQWKSGVGETLSRDDGRHTGSYPPSQHLFYQSSHRDCQTN